MRHAIPLMALLVASSLAPDSIAGCKHARPPSCAAFDPLFQAQGKAHHIPWRLLRALAWRESKCAPCVVSHAGARGVMQIIPTTFAALGPFAEVDDPFDPAHSIAAGAYYLGALLSWYGGDVRKALAAYNTGPGRVDAGRIPSATDAYVDDILEHFHHLGGTFR